MITIMIADDHVVVREGLATLVGLEQDFQVVAQAANGNEAVEHWSAYRPHVTLLDLKMPVLDGVATIGAIRAIDPGARVIVLTTFDGDEDIFRALRAGARGYLLKDVAPEVLLNAIRVVHAGRKLIPPEVAQKLAERAGIDELTERERAVLQLVVQGQSNAEIANRLQIAESTVKFHVSHVLAKLQVPDRAQAIVVALRRGLARL